MDWSAVFFMVGVAVAGFTVGMTVDRFLVAKQVQEFYENAREILLEAQKVLFAASEVSIEHDETTQQIKVWDPTLNNGRGGYA